MALAVQEIRQKWDGFGLCISPLERATRFVPYIAEELFSGRLAAVSSSKKAELLGVVDLTCLGERQNFQIKLGDAGDHRVEVYVLPATAEAPRLVTLVIPLGENKRGVASWVLRCVKDWKSSPEGASLSENGTLVEVLRDDHVQGKPEQIVVTAQYYQFGEADRSLEQERVRALRGLLDCSVNPRKSSPPQAEIHLPEMQRPAKGEVIDLPQFAKELGYDDISHLNLTPFAYHDHEGNIVRGVRLPAKQADQLEKQYRAYLEVLKRNGIMADHSQVPHYVPHLDLIPAPDGRSPQAVFYTVWSGEQEQDYNEAYKRGDMVAFDKFQADYFLNLLTSVFPAS